VFKIGEGGYADKTGLKISKQQIVENQTDDGVLGDVKWNTRHHFHHSVNNEKSHKYYRVSPSRQLIFFKAYFEKGHRQTEERALTPHKCPDPYEENEIKGTRMPDYAKVSKERDVFGELGWLPNFEVKNSKNNASRHVNFRELFDNPKDYQTEFHKASLTNTNFFRSNAPIESVASKTLGSAQSV
jgi:hypothetical protein